MLLGFDAPGSLNQRWERDGRRRMAKPGDKLTSIQLVTTHPVLGASLHSILPSVQQFLASDHKTLLLNTQRRVSLGNWKLLGISILACLFVPLMNLLPVQSEILASTRVWCQLERANPWRYVTRIAWGEREALWFFTQQLEVVGKQTCTVWNRHKDMYFKGRKGSKCRFLRLRTFTEWVLGKNEDTQILAALCFISFMTLTKSLNSTTWLDF